MIDYLSQHLWQTWAVIAVICLILELTAGDFWDSASIPSWCSSLSLR